MKLPFKILMTFVAGWVLGEVLHQDYEHKLFIASLGAITFAYGAGVHTILWRGVAPAKSDHLISV